MIYEFALPASVPINVVPMEMGSNMFMTNHRCGKSLQAVRTFNALIRTCKTIYTDLTRFPVFYRVNQFKHRSFHELLLFLAALTPYKRSKIRYLKVDAILGDWYSGITGLNKFSQGDYATLVMTLLRECHDLKELVVSTNMRPRDFQRQLGLWTQLSECRYPSLLAMPQVKVTMASFSWASELDLDDPAPGSTAYDHGEYSRLFSSEADRDYFDRIRLDMVQKRKRIFEDQEKEKRKAEKERQDVEQQDVDQQGKRVQAKGSMNPELQHALIASGVHFPGEDRMSLDRLKSTLGHVSSRTRSHCNGVSAMGAMIRPKKQRYTAEGMLNSRTITICGICSVNDEVECQVQETQGDFTKRVWESINTLMTDEGLSALLYFYKRSFRAGRSRSRRAHLEKLTELEEMVSPREVLRLTNNLEIARIRADPNDRNFVPTFLTFHSRYKSRLAKLRKSLGIEPRSSIGAAKS